MAAGESGIAASSLGPLWHQERRRVAAILLAHMPRGSDLEDLLQEVGLSLVKNHASIRSPGAVRGWLRTVAINVARDAGRKASVHSRVFAKTGGVWNDQEVQDHRGERDRERDRAREAVAETIALLENLPVDYREPMLLRAEGRSQKEIAHALGLSESAVETRLVRARRMLRKAVTRSRGAL